MAGGRGAVVRWWACRRYGRRLRERAQRLSHLAGGLRDAFERDLQIAMDVVVERLERRDIENAHAARQRLFESLPPEIVETGEEGGERFAGAGRREDERVPSGGDVRPTETLWRRRFAERGAEPFAHRRHSRKRLHTEPHGGPLDWHAVGSAVVSVRGLAGTLSWRCTSRLWHCGHSIASASLNTNVSNVCSHFGQA